jgi:hypothetical protein
MSDAPYAVSREARATVRERWRRFADLAFTDRSPEALARASERSRATKPGEPALPLTHHEIVALTVPLARTGRRVDLGASDRMRRRLVFVPDTGRGEATADAIVVESRRNGGFRVERQLGHDDGPRAAVLVEAVDAETAVRRADAVDSSRLREEGSGWTIHRRMRIGTDGGALLPVAATITLDAATVEVRFPEVTGLPARLRIHPRRGRRLVLTDDLLAVLGWDWSPLRRVGSAWEGSVRLRGVDAADQAGHLSRTLARHLATTLDAPPRRFHERLWLQRVGVVVRRAVPLVALLVLVLEFALAPELRMARANPLVFLALAAPLLLVLGFMRWSEDPRFELPRWPRPSAEPAWAPAD